MNIAVSSDFVATAPFTPPLSPVSSNSHVRINGVPVTRVGDVVETHTDLTVTPPVPHTGVMQSSMQNYVRINGANIIVNGDAASCLPTHTIIATGYVQIN